VGIKVTGMILGLNPLTITAKARAPVPLEVVMNAINHQPERLPDLLSIEIAGRVPAPPPPSVPASPPGSGGAVAACKASGNPLFQDQFDTFNDTWGTSKNYNVENGKLVIRPSAGFNTAAINKSSLYDNVDICVEMTVPPPVVKGNCGAIIFWAADYDNYYSFQVTTDGQASVWRRQRGKWLEQVSWRDFASVAKDANQVNELRVLTAGNKAKLFVNGTLFKELKGQPPKDGSLIGLLACSPNDASATVAFGNLVVNTPSPETEPTADKIPEETKGSNNGGDVSGGAGAAGGGDTGASGGAPAGGDTGK